MPDPRAYSYPDDILKDRIILITGSSDGIGKALALHAAELGADDVLEALEIDLVDRGQAISSWRYSISAG